jgi:N-acylneuraminate cytidylyltransferase
MKEKGKKNNIVAFIPLRGRSKSIPLKNIKILGGKPLAYWVIEAALKCSLIDKVFVSTDSEIIKDTIAKIKSKKLEIIGRSEETATDEATTESAMLEFAKNNNFNDIVLIQATSPLLETKHLAQGIKKYLTKGCGGLLSVVRQKRFIWAEDRNVAKPVNYNPEKRPRRQNFEGFLVENGAFYITTRKRLLEKKVRISGKILTYEMPEQSYFELDEPSDWIIIGELLKQKKL